MNKIEVVAGLEEISESRVDELRKQVLVQRAKVLKLYDLGSTIRNSIYDILLQVNKDHRIENIDDVCDFMEKIEEGFGLVSDDDTDVSKLYSEIIREYYEVGIERESKKLAKQDAEVVTAEFPNSDEDIFNNPDASVEEVISAVEARLELYKDLISRVEKSNETHERLLARLRELQKFYDELAEKYDMSNVRHPRIEDYEVEIER